MGKIYLISLGIGCFMTMMACTPPTLEINLPEEKRRLINSLRVFEIQKVKNINFRHLMTFPEFQPLDLSNYPDTSTVPIARKKYLQMAKEHFDSEESESLGEEAEMFSVHQGLNLLSVGNTSLDMISTYRLKEEKLMEINLLYVGVEDMRLRLEKLGLSEDATLHTAIEKGAFDKGHVFIMEQPKIQQREGENY